MYVLTIRFIIFYHFLSFFLSFFQSHFFIIFIFSFVAGHAHGLRWEPVWARGHWEDGIRQGARASVRPSSEPAGGRLVQVLGCCLSLLVVAPC